MNRALFLDRDGVLNQVVMRNGKAASPRCIEELKMIPEAISLLFAAKQLGYLTVMITNQPDISRGMMTRYQLNELHAAIKQAMPIDHIEVCTSSSDRCFRRKPNPGMLLDATRKRAIDVSASYFVGDSIKDVEAGAKAGVRTILYQTSYNTANHGKGDFNCNSFDEILSIIRN